MQYIVENSNGIPGIASIRYSVTKGANGKVLNLIVQSDCDYMFPTVTLVDPGLGDKPGDFYLVLNRGNYRSETDHRLNQFTYALLPYNPTTNKRKEYRAQIPIPNDYLDFISIRDTHVRVEGWNYEQFGISDDPELYTDGDDIAIYGVFGLGMIEVKDLVNIEPETTGDDKILKFDVKSFTTPEALQILKDLAGTGIILQAA
jgi:hypothetical protein